MCCYICQINLQFYQLHVPEASVILVWLQIIGFLEKIIGFLEKIIGFLEKIVPLGKYIM